MPPVPCDASPDPGTSPTASPATVTRGTARLPRLPLPRLEVAVRWALAVGIAYQVVQRFTYTGYGMSEYGRSLWYVNYRHGFVRRGLAGEALRTALGRHPTIAEIDLVQNVVALTTIGAMVALVAMLCRRRTTIAYATAAALVVAPFAFDSVGGQRRPDLLAFLLLAGVGIWAGARAVAPARLALVAGALLAVCTLASEAAPLIVGPWLVIVLLANDRARRGPDARPWLITALASVPTLLVLAGLALHGAPSPTHVAMLELDAPSIIGGHGSVFVYLGDTFSSSFQRVIERPNPEISIVLGALLLALLAIAFHDARGYLRAATTWLLPARSARRAWCAATALLTLALFALGFDWLRWMGTITFAGLLAVCAVVLIDGRATHPVPEHPHWHPRLPDRVQVSGRGVAAIAAATYLLVLPPLPNFVNDVVVGARLLFDIPR